MDERAAKIALAAQVCADPPTDAQIRELNRCIYKMPRDIEALFRR